jgi:TonB family protein
MFDKIAAGAGSPIELDSRGTQIGSEAVKPKFQEEGTSAQDAAKAAGSAKKSGFSLSGDLTRGDIVSGPFPAYPAWARQKGLSNVTISVRFSVDASGNVNPTMIVQKSTGYPAWDTAVKSTLGRWKFKPAEGGMGKRNGVITFVFILT